MDHPQVKQPGMKWHHLKQYEQLAEYGNMITPLLFTDSELCIIMLMLSSGE
jgi:hypothetical protein